MARGELKSPREPTSTIPIGSTPLLALLLPAPAPPHEVNHLGWVSLKLILEEPGGCQHGQSKVLGGLGLGWENPIAMLVTGSIEGYEMPCSKVIPFGILAHLLHFGEELLTTTLGYTRGSSLFLFLWRSEVVDGSHPILEGRLRSWNRAAQDDLSVG